MPVSAVKARIFFSISVLIFVSVAVIGVVFFKAKKGSVYFQLEPAMLEVIEHKFGSAAKQRFVDWQKLIDTGKTITELEKLQQVNDFFNHNIAFSDDLVVWKKADYWATPFELLSIGAGDCEDYSIAKYFTLVELGIDQSKLRITYVTVLGLNNRHMVLTYFESSHAVPLVLDNINPNIIASTDRRDLSPVYSFNGSGLWLAKMKSNGQLVGNADQLNLWANLKQQMLEKPF